RITLDRLTVTVIMGGPSWPWTTCPATHNPSRNARPTPQFLFTPPNPPWPPMNASPSVSSEKGNRRGLPLPFAATVRAELCNLARDKLSEARTVSQPIKIPGLILCPPGRLQPDT